MTPTITLDLETLPAAWSGAERLAAWEDECRTAEKYGRPPASLDEVWRATSLNSMQGRIGCVGWAIGDEEVKSRITADETALRSVFDEILFDLDRVALRTADNGAQWHDPVCWIGHNVKDFDLVWLYRWAHRLQHPLAGLIPPEDKLKNRGWLRVIDDTMDLWKGPAWKGNVSLDDLAAFLGLPGKPPGIDGASVHDLWLRGEHETIRRYCAGDVGLARDVWRRLRGYIERVGVGTPRWEEAPFLPGPKPLATPDLYDAVADSDIR